jgi:hypothetical protein
VRTTLIVVPPKRIDLLLRIVDRVEPMHVQALFAEPAVERLDRVIVSRLAPATEVEDDIRDSRVLKQVADFSADESAPPVSPRPHAGLIEATAICTGPAIVMLPSRP